MRATLACLGLGALVGAAACKKNEPPAPPPAPVAEPTRPAPASPATVDPGRLAIFKPPLPASFDSPKHPSTPEKIALGRMLFFEKRISKSHELSCNSCHNLGTYGVDNLRVSLGHKKQPGKRNSPTVYNAAGHFVQFWDGRAADVEEQATGPVLNPVEMAMGGDRQVLDTLRSMPGYVAAFKKAFPEDKDPITLKNFAEAIGAFERKLVTPAPWDRFLAGDQGALTDAEKAGFNKFMDTGCMACHNGTLVGGGQFQKAGAVEPWPNQEDLGRYEVTKQDADKMLFKVPSLRNVAMTAPYFHDGSSPTLEDAVNNMAKRQLGKVLPREDIVSIVTWLRTLTGKIPEEYIKAPELPASTAKTPKPDAT